MDQGPLKTVRAAAAALARGDLVGLPTETVYGLGADASNAEAVAKIFAAKGRPHFNPLISHVASLEAAEALGVFSPLARRLAEAFWPGPLSLVVPRQPDCAVCDLACAGLDTIALRVPSHPLMQQVLRAFAKPVAAPSANVSGRPSPTNAAHVREEFGDRIALVLDGGPSAVGLESAVVSVIGDQATLLRLGGLSREALEAVAGPLLAPDASAKAAPASPGMVLRHYAPRAPVRLNGSSAQAGEVMIGFGPGYEGAEFNLSPSGDLVEAAAQLFALLRAADALNPSAIVIAAIPETGLGEAIADRLRRAAEH
ncbi:MAG: threonylcarbamoyl-AMP synthase [Alphaproteobacteria bacterium PA3]|nr:MAG: threonylcarbamoyl-AMP synthase [Alphaproteobacteria bacterium PA3]